MNERTVINRIWDKLGICASVLCLIHCIATPVLLLIFPTTNFFFFDASHMHEAHEIFAVVVVISMLIAVYPTCRKHGHKDIIALALSGITFVLAAVFLHDTLNEHLDHLLTIVGSILLIIAHVKNMKVRHGKCTSHAHSH